MFQDFVESDLEGSKAQKHLFGKVIDINFKREY